VLTGKVVSAERWALVGANAGDGGGAKNTLMDSPLQPFHRGAMGLILRRPMDRRRFHPEGGGRPQSCPGKVRRRRGRSLVGADARLRGLVDSLGGF
jgi:hypothetical protein